MLGFQDQYIFFPFDGYCSILLAWALSSRSELRHLANLVQLHSLTKMGYQVVEIQDRS